MSRSKFEYKDKEDQGWDFYWNTQENSSRKIYDVIAQFYRIYLIKGSLNHFINKHLAKKTSVLHAGCGSGQVDTDIINDYQLIALDISEKALEIYQKVNGDKAKRIQGSIFSLPFADQSLDGIYNLGVMEHFTEEDITKIMLEFKRVLKPDGKMVLFWPPEFGLSVIFFKILVKIYALFGKKNVKFHPDEITRVRSQKHITQFIEGMGLKVRDYYFGIKDFFTYSVIVVGNQ